MGENILINSKTSEKAYIGKSAIDGEGVFARRKISPDEPIAYFEGYPTPEKTKHSLHFDGKTIEPIGDLQFLNHSCNPNAYFVDRWLIAKHEIEDGEELIIDYSATENNVSHPFFCNCGPINCRGYIC